MFSSGSSNFPLFPSIPFTLLPLVLVTKYLRIKGLHLLDTLGGVGHRLLRSMYI